MRSTRRPGISVEVEDQPRLYSPRLQRIMSEIGHLTPRRGPSFLIIGGVGRDYLQIAGGDGIFVLERRDYGETTFQHFAAGRLGKSAGTWVEVPTNGGRLTVRANERLKLREARLLATDFIEGRGRSERFAWRDMTADFT